MRAQPQSSHSRGRLRKTSSRVVLLSGSRVSGILFIIACIVSCIGEKVPSRNGALRELGYQEVADLVEDCVRDLVLGSGRLAARLAGAVHDGDLVDVRAESAPARDVIDDEEVGALAPRLRPTSASRALSRTASRSSRAVSTRVTRRAGAAGSGRCTLAAMRCTLAPRTSAAWARAIPCRPEDLLPRNRTGSIGSIVPPALIVIAQVGRRPRRQARARRR